MKQNPERFGDVVAAMNNDEQRNRQTSKRSDKSEKPSQPFDISDLGNIPSAGKDHPPYRGWWVVDADDEEPLAV